VKPSKKTILAWLVLVALSVIFQIMLGGYVRLTQSGLSMYDWHVVHGVIPPLSEESWQETFDNYKHTPEYTKINVGMSLEEYKLIYLREYNHRILGRITGLIFVLPLFTFLFLGKLKWRDSKIYLLTGLLYAGQGVLGWYMVKSGLVDQPHVSHYRLTAHLLMAFLILALVLWKILDTVFNEVNIKRETFQKQSFRIVAIFFLLLLFQISYGAFMAGLKAGYVSDTFPLMFGYLFPPNLLEDVFPGLTNFTKNGVMVHFIHRWFAFVVFGFSIYSWIRLKSQLSVTLWLPVIIVLQILLGLFVIWYHVPVALALIHQLGAVIILGFTVFLLHRLYT
jgi:heme a synthase